MKHGFFILVRFSVAALLLFILHYSGHLDFGVFAQISPTVLLVTLPFYLIAFLVAIYRWWLLVRGMEISGSLWNVTRLTMTGLWVSSVFPGGSVFAGDAARATLLGRENPGTYTVSAVSVLMDRVLGMFAILMIAIVALLVNPSLVMKSLWLQLLTMTLVLTMIVPLSIVILAFSQRTYNWVLCSRLIKQIPGRSLLLKIMESFYLFRKCPKVLVKGHLISYIGHGSMICAIYILSTAVGITLDSIPEYLFAISVGIISSMFPISGPVGIGVGNVGFAVAFHLVNSDHGAELAILWQVTFILASQLGLLFFLVGRKTGVSHK